MSDYTATNTAYPASEQQVIGGLIDRAPLFKKYAPVLSAEDFSDSVFKVVFELIRGQWGKSKEVDTALLFSKLQPDDSDIKTAILECAECFVSESTFADHIRLIKEAAQRRQIKQGVEDILREGDYSAHRLNGLIESLDSSTGGGIENKSSANINAFIQELNKPKPVFSTGFKELDEAIGGIRRGTLFVIGARPSTGKTTFAINLAREQLRYKRRVMFFSLEMTAQMILERYSADVCRIDLWKFSKNRLSQQEQSIVESTAKSLESGKRFLIEQDTNTIEGITSAIYAENPDLVFVDYVQRVRSVREFKSERERVNYITSELKTAAKKTNCCVMLLSQITRTGKDAPKMSDLKESGALEEDGDYIVLLHRPYVLDKTCDEPPEKTVVILDKNKFGACAATTMNFNLGQQRFEEYANF